MDDSLIERAVKTYGNTVLRAAFSVTGNLPDAEDIFSDVFFELFKRQKPFNDENHLKAWLIRSSINRAKNLKTSAYNRRRAELTENIEAKEPIFNVDLVNAIKKLKDEERAIIYLHYFEGYTFKEIAKILKLREASVRSKAFRARAVLKDFLSD